MPKWLRLLIMDWSRILQYRGDVLLWMIVENASPLVSLAIWFTVAKYSSNGPSPTETVTYYMFMMFIVIVTNSWGGFFLSREILNGEVVKYLIRPMSVFTAYFTSNVVEKAMKLLIPIPLLLLAVVLLPHLFSESIYIPMNIGFFLISLLLGFFLNFLIDMNFATLAFWLEDIMQIRRYSDLVQEVTSGVLIPFRFLPSWAFGLFSILPFRYIYSAPAEIILAWTSPSFLITRQLLWIAGLFILLTITWRAGLKRYAPPGQ